MVIFQIFLSFLYVYQRVSHDNPIYSPKKNCTVLGLQPLATASPVATLLGCCREAFVKRGRYRSKATFAGL
jgi:hypothetical protein